MKSKRLSIDISISMRGIVRTSGCWSKCVSASNLRSRHPRNEIVYSHQPWKLWPKSLSSSLAVTHLNISNLWVRSANNVKENSLPPTREPPSRGLDVTVQIGVGCCLRHIKKVTGRSVTYTWSALSYEDIVGESENASWVEPKPSLLSDDDWMCSLIDWLRQTL